MICHFICFVIAYYTRISRITRNNSILLFAQALQKIENSDILDTILNFVVEGFTLGWNVFVHKYFLPALISAPRHKMASFLSYILVAAGKSRRCGMAPAQIQVFYPTNQNGQFCVAGQISAGTENPATSHKW